MISIEEILQQLMRGTMTYQRAKTEIEELIAAAADASEPDGGIRDVFAGLAMQAIITSSWHELPFDSIACADEAYTMADAMMNARSL